jgi:DNA repair protein RadC
MPKPILRRPRPERVFPARLVGTSQPTCVTQALQHLYNQLNQPGVAMKDSVAVGYFLRLQLVSEPNEVLGVMFLDQLGRLIGFELVGQGSLRSVPMYCREIVRRCLDYNAASIIVAHNHPSGVVRPSSADKLANQKLRTSCELFDIRVIDSLIVGGDQRMEIYSSAKHDWA